MGIPEARSTKFCKMQAKGIFWAHVFFEIGTCAEYLHNATSKNTIFIRATPYQTGLALNKPLPDSGVSFYKTELLGEQFVTFGATLFLWNAYLYCVKHVWGWNRLLGGPRTGPFLKQRGPQNRRPAYIYICCSVIIWSNFEGFYKLITGPSLKLLSGLFSYFTLFYGVFWMFVNVQRVCKRAKKCTQKKGHFWSCAFRNRRCHLLFLSFYVVESQTEKGSKMKKMRHAQENSFLVRTSSTMTRDRNLQFRGAVSTGGSPLDCLLFLQYLCAI